MKVRIKVHNAYRKIVAISDVDLLGKKFIEGNRQIDVDKNFYDGEEVEEDRAMEIIRAENYDDSTFNIVGDYSVKLAIKMGLIEDNQKSILKIKGVPLALGLL